MPTLYIMCGVGFSGKSTLAKKISERTGAILVSQDALFLEKEKELNLDQDSDDQWRMLLEMCKEKIYQYLSEGKSVVYDSTNTRFEHREEIRKVAEPLGVQTKIILLDTPIEVQTERQKKNLETGERHDVKQEYLDQAIAELEIPAESENTLTFKPDDNVEDFLQWI
ncbi:MAG: ATP-binding protein [Patescibacteria group bacterium]